MAQNNMIKIGYKRNGHIDINTHVCTVKYKGGKKYKHVL